MNFTKIAKNVLHSDQGCERERLTPGTHATERQTGETLVAGETRRRRGLGRIQGHLRVPLIKATLLTYFTRALLDPRVFAVGNGGAAVLCGVMLADLGNSNTVELHAKQQ